MTLAERTQSCLRQMAEHAEVGDEEWLRWFAEYLGLKGEECPDWASKYQNIQVWWARGREDREVLLGLQSIQDAQN